MLAYNIMRYALFATVGATVMFYFPIAQTRVESRRNTIEDYPLGARGTV